jgi:hypothetical protein
VVSAGGALRRMGLCAADVADELSHEPVTKRADRLGELVRRGAAAVQSIDFDHKKSGIRCHHLKKLNIHGLTY